MTEKFPSTTLSGINSSVFTHSQLRQVLSAYAEGVLYKNWKDYAIDCAKDQTTFCVIERGQGAPMAVIYSISKTRSKNKDFYRVYDGERMICRCDGFLEALSVFRQIGDPKVKKARKFNVIK